MSRMSALNSSASRNLTLTEELEKLEQSITLTLQEIDHNFSKAHRIVTTSILPIVEQYAQHSSNVWEGSKFWKQFFEASANVSLSGYEEPELEEDYTQQDTTHESTFQTPDAREGGDTITGAEGDMYEDDGLEESLLDSPSNATGVHSTPHIASTGPRGKAKFSSPPPPKSSTRRQPFRNMEAPEEPSTPRHQPAQTLDSSPFEPPSAYQVSTAQRQNHDPLLHRILDKNYRIQATPHTQRKQQQSATTRATPATATQAGKSTIFDSSPMSPDIAAPVLRSDLFSPAPGSVKRSTQPRTPGISVQTPGKERMTSTAPSLFSANATKTVLWESDESEGEEEMMSPPKTMQFHIPQSRLLQTPAREASKQIVEDLLRTAGAEDTDEIEGVGMEKESPSLVRRKWDDDDTF